MAKRIPLLRALEARFTDLSRDDLYARIMCGEVTVDGEILRDPKILISTECECEFLSVRYVSRGGLKLEGALEDHDINPENRIVLDAGASTGGFTQCLLNRGAKQVHSVDVGYNQLAYSLRQDSRVLVHERCNIMDVTTLDPRPDFAVADLSFRSLRGAASHLLDLVSDGFLLALVKPQFEWRNPPKSFRGVVEQVDDLVEILSDLAVDFSRDGMQIRRMTESRIQGRHGNREFFFLLEPGCADIDRFIAQIRDIVVSD